jgi:hypothetical protein
VQWSGEAGGQQSSSSPFSLVKRWQHMHKNASMSSPKPGEHSILVIATTPEGEVRAFTLCTDTRLITAQLVIQLPQDGQISRLLFLNVDASNHLDRIGQVEVGLPDGTPQSAPKNKNSSSVAR